MCGTDLHIEAGEYPSAPPVTMGHEVSGVVVAVGEGVDPAWLGARVVCETYFSTCGVCEWCRDGRPNLCPERRSIGSFVDGGFAEQLVMPATAVHRIPDWLDEHAAVLAEPLACVCHCLLDPPKVSTGDRVLVTGPGTRRAAGGPGGAGAGRRRARRRACRPTSRGSLSRSSSGSRPTPAAPRRPTFDVVIECSGSAGGAATCLEAARRRGTYVQIGVFGKPVTRSARPRLPEGARR